ESVQSIKNHRKLGTLFEVGFCGQGKRGQRREGLAALLERGPQHPLRGSCRVTRALAAILPAAVPSGQSGDIENPVQEPNKAAQPIMWRNLQLPLCALHKWSRRQNMRCP